MILYVIPMVSVVRRSSGNTALLTGPVGCGKTTSVYALAQHLGYKVSQACSVG